MRGRRVLRHGTTIHGAQLLGPGYRHRPISYYGVSTGIGLVMAQRGQGHPLEIGIVGMGAGSLAAYGEAGDRIRFYEIDPSVVGFAGRDGYFTFLEDSQASIEIIPGDGRLSLQRELDRGQRNRFDLLVIDAFSSDSIPFHLMTREAYALFLEHLKPSGLIAVHASSRHFNLEPILYRVGESPRSRSHEREQHAFRNEGCSPRQMDLPEPRSGKNRSLEAARRKAHARIGLDTSKLFFGELEPSGYMQEPLWTNDFNSLLSVLKKLN